MLKTYTGSYHCGRPTCGVLPFRRPRTRTSAELQRGMEPFTGCINVRCLDGVDLDGIAVKHVFGSRL